MQKYENYNNT